MSRPTSEYSVQEALLSAERKFIKDEIMVTTGPYDLRKMIGEINFFESIDRNYITAQIGILDDSGFIANNVELQGTETLKLTISSEEGTTPNEIVIELRVVSIVAQSKLNDRATFYNINCISKHAYTDAAVKLSRSYTGQLENITEKVLKDYLGVDVKREEDYILADEKSAQGKRKLVVPYISPLETADWLMERITDKDGFPWFNWTTVWDQDKTTGKDNIKFGTLGTMINKGIERSEDQRNYTFVRVYSASNRTVTAEGNRNAIVDFDYKSSDNTLMSINEGVIGSMMSSLDTYTSQKQERHFSIEEYITKKVKPRLSKSKATLGRIFDEEDKLEIRGLSKSPAEFDARYKNMMTSYGTYEWETGYHDNFDGTELLFKITKSCMREILDKNNIDVTLPGYNFMKEELGAGDVIRLEIPTPQVGDKGQADLDERASGYYLIQKLRHIFSGETHRVVCTVAKVSDER